MTEFDLKKEFARYLLENPNDPFKAALLVFPDDNGIALRIANEWPLDKEVIAIKKELIAEEGELAFLPSKAKHAKQVWDKMQKCYDNTEYARLSKEYRELMGWVNKSEDRGGVDNLSEAFAEISKRLPV
jgi:hypothetical protein